MSAPNRFVAARSLAAAAGKCYWQMVAPALTPPLTSKQYIRSIEIILVTAVATEIVLADATGGTAVLIGAPLPVGPNGQLVSSFAPPAATFGISFTVEPTPATDVIRRVTFPAVVGVGVLWEFEEGELYTEGGGHSLVLQNVGAGAGGLLDINCSYFGT